MKYGLAPRPKWFAIYAMPTGMWISSGNIVGPLMRKLHCSRRVYPTTIAVPIPKYPNALGATAFVSA